MAMAKGIDFLSTDIKDYEINKVREAYRNLNMYIDKMYDMISKIELGLIGKKTLKEMVERLNSFGYVEFKGNNYYAETIKKIAEAHNNVFTQLIPSYARSEFKTLVENAKPLSE